MSIQCVELSKRYGKKEVLKNVSVEIREGVITGLIGPNGAGKSTLIKLITGLIYPTSGCCRIDGYDSCSEHIEAMNRLGAIVEWPSFYPDLSARKNLAIISGGHGKAYEEKVEEVTQFLGIRSYLDRKTNTFSTGMKQRLGIALAMLPDSKYIILDEPANGLDPSGIVEIRQLIRECNRKAGITILVSSHLLNEMELICDDVLMIVDGELRASGPLEKLLHGEHKYRLQSSRQADCLTVLTRAWESNALPLTAAPVQTADGITVSLADAFSPELVTGELFRNGLPIAHFARENATLEEFFISRSQKGEKR